MHAPHDWEHEGLDPDGPSAADLDRFGAETVACAACGAEVWDQSDACHACGTPLGNPETDTPTSRSKVAMLILLLILGVMGAAAFL